MSAIVAPASTPLISASQGFTPCFGIRNSYASLEEALQRQGLIEYDTVHPLTEHNSEKEASVAPQAPTASGCRTAEE